MTTLQIRGVPVEVSEALKRQARARGMSLSAYALERLSAIAEEVSFSEAWADGRRRHGPVHRLGAAEFIRADRDDH